MKQYVVGYLKNLEIIQDYFPHVDHELLGIFDDIEKAKKALKERIKKTINQVEKFEAEHPGRTNAGYYEDDRPTVYEVENEKITDISESFMEEINFHDMYKKEKAKKGEISLHEISKCLTEKQNPSVDI